MLNVSKKLADIAAKELEQQDRYASFLVYGEIGTQKTRSLLTAPKPLLLYNFDHGGPKVLGNRPSEQGIYVISPEGDAATKYKAWEREHNSLVQEKAFEGIATVVIDSFSSFVECELEHIKATLKNKDGRQDYQALHAFHTKLFNKLNALPCHRILICHAIQTIVVENDVSKVVRELLMPGQAKIKVPAQFDEVWRFYVKKGPGEKKIMVQTEKDSQWEARTRIGGGALHGKEIEPDYRAALKMAGYNWEDKA